MVSTWPEVSAFLFLSVNELGSKALWVCSTTWTSNFTMLGVCWYVILRSTSAQGGFCLPSNQVLGLRRYSAFPTCRSFGLVTGQIFMAQAVTEQLTTEAFSMFCLAWLADTKELVVLKVDQKNVVSVFVFLPSASKCFIFQEASPAICLSLAWRCLAVFAGEGWWLKCLLKIHFK